MKTFDRRFWLRNVGALVAVVSTSACVHRPVTAPVAIVPDMVRSEVRVAAAPSSQFGDMMALGVGLSNGAATTYLVSGARIYAIDRAGYRVAPLTVEEAARQAGGTAELVAGLQGLSLRDHALEPGMPMSGFVFYPEYVGVRAFVINEVTHDVVEVGGDVIEAGS